MALVIEPCVENALCDFLRQKNINNFKLILSEACSEGDNQLSRLYKVKVVPDMRCSTNDDNDQMLDLKYVCKVTIKNEARRKFQNIRSLFLREIYFYNDILKQFKNLESEFNLEPAARLYETPECVYFSDTFPELIVMPDVAFEGYSMFNRHETLDFQHVHLALTTLGKFHALSFVLRDKKPDIFKDIVETVKEDTLFPDGRDNKDKIEITMFITPFSREYFKISLNHLKANSNEFQNYDKIIQTFEYIRDNLLTILVDAVKGKFCEPYAILCHGDFWNNNLMYKKNVCMYIKVCSYIYIIYFQLE